MAPVERTAVVSATPETVWKACFEHMKFEVWDEDVKEVTDVSGPCENGTKFTFVMKSGDMKVPQELSNVTKNESLTFSGSFMGMKAIGTLTLTPEGTDKTKVDYKFDLEGVLGYVAKLLNNKAVVGGTEKGLENIVRLSEEAQKSGK